MICKANVKKVIIYISVDIEKEAAEFSDAMLRADIEVLREADGAKVKKLLKEAACVSTFFITDDAKSAALSKEYGIGVAVYDDDKSREGDFNGVLYRIMDLTDVDVTLLNRMLLRDLRLPWTILTTDRFIVREITEDDIGRLYEMYEDEDIKKYTEPLYDNPEDELDYIRKTIDIQYRFNEYGIWIIEDRNTGEIAGRAGICDRAGYDDKEVGFVIAHEYRRRGVAYEVMSAIMEYGRDELNIRHFNAFTIPENVAGRALLNKLGFSEKNNESCVKDAVMGDLILYYNDMS